MSDDRPGPPRGRRRGSPDTRGEILRAARDRFVTDGFAGTSVRAVARDAGVDPALIHHYFGDKVGLLLAVGSIAYDPRRLVHALARGGRSGMGLRIVRGALEVWESPIGTTLFTALRADARLLPAVGAVITDEVIDAAVREVQVPPDRVQERVALVQSLLGGLIMTRYLARTEPIVSMRPPQLVRLFGPVVQQAIDGAFDTRHP